MVTYQPPYVIGIDAGTAAIKAGLYDLRGHSLAYGVAEYGTAFPHAGWAEQSPDDWWRGLVAAVRSCLAQARVRPEDVIALSADATTCTMVLLDKQGIPIGPALLWMDVRAAEEAQDIFASSHDALCYSLAGINAEWMPPKMPVGTQLGGLTSQAAAALGLQAGIPVAVNGGDAFVSLLGLGVTQPGDLAMIAGTSNVHAGLSTERFHTPGIFGAYPDAVLPGIYLVEGGQVTTGAILAWFRNHFAKDLVAQGQTSGMSAYPLLEAEAAQIPIGSDGLVVLDYFQGNRTPHTDSLARGAVWGLSLQSSRGHVYRAIMEGIAYGTRDILETFKRNNYTVKRIVACGGATRSPLFMQIYADVTGVSIALTEETEATLLSSAILAAFSAGVFPSLVEASQQMVRPTTSYSPDSERHARYTTFYNLYTETYPHMRDLMHRMSRTVAQ